MKKIIGIFIIMLLISTTISVMGINIDTKVIDFKNNDDIKFNSVSPFNGLPAPNPPWLLEGSDQNQISECYRGIRAVNPYILAQEFKPNVNNLTAVAIKIFENGFPFIELDITISIRDSLNGSDLTEITIIEDEWLMHYGWIIIDFDDITVIPEKTYYILCRSALSDSNKEYLCWFYDYNNTYNCGMAWYSEDSGESWYDLEDVYPEYPKVDFCFVTYWKTPKNRALYFKSLTILECLTNSFPIFRILLQRLG